MKVKFAGDTTLQAVGVRGTSAFNIATTAHMFHILSSGLYSDKVTAVLRELGCNAMDAHIMSGQPNRPFEVKLPTKLDPTFYIKDWGQGLDHAEVTELYTTYGMSTKQLSNDATGAFGLGSKSPFAYADIFSIVAVKDGIRRVYTAHKENDAPVISLQSEGPADEDWTHGVMVSLPVAPSDSDEFRSKALQVFRWFDTLPTVLGLGARELEAAVPTFQYRSEHYAFGSNRLDERATVIMGNVAYPLDISRIEGAGVLHWLFADAGIHLWMPLGTVMPTPSRESLQYDKEGQAALIDAMNEAGRDFARKLLVELQALERTSWDYAISVRKLLKKVPRLTWSGSGMNVLMGLMQEVGASQADLANLEKALKNDLFALPRWVARWPRAQEAAGFNPSGKLSVSESMGPPTPQEVEQLQLNQLPGVAVQFLALRSDRDKPCVSARTLYAGCVEMKSDREPLRLPYNESLRVYFTDCAYGVQRVRQHMVENKVEYALLVSGARKCWDGVKLYAEALAGPMGLDMSSAPVPASTLAAVEIRRYKSGDKKDKATRVSRYGEQSVDYFDVMTGRWETAPVKDIDEDGVCYIKQVSRTSNSWRSTFQLEYGRILRRSELESSLNALKAFVSKCGDLWSGPKTVLLVRAAPLKRLQKFYEEELPPAATAVREALSDRAVLKVLAARLEGYPVVRLESSYEYQQAGLAGYLAWSLYRKQPGAAEFVRRFPNLSMVKHAAGLLEAHRDSKHGVNLREALNSLVWFVPDLSAKLVKHNTGAVTVESIAQECKEQHPFAGFLNFQTLFGLKDEEFETALPLLESVFGPAAPVTVQALAA